MGLTISQRCQRILAHLNPSRLNLDVFFNNPGGLQCWLRVLSKRGSAHSRILFV